MRHALALRVVTTHLIKITDVAQVVIKELAQRPRAMVARPVIQAQALQHALALRAVTTHPIRTTVVTQADGKVQAQPVRVTVEILAGQLQLHQLAPVRQVNQPLKLVLLIRKNLQVECQVAHVVTSVAIFRKSVYLAI